MSKVYTYRRVSVLERKSHSYSLEWQSNYIADWLKREGLTADGDFVDDGASGSIPIKDRPEGRKLITAAAGEGALIVAATVDRVFRSIYDMAVTCKDWEDKGVKIRFIREGFDLGNMFGKFHVGIMVCFAQLEREMIRARQVAMIKDRRARGLKVPGEVPYGWQIKPGEPVAAAAPGAQPLEQNPEEQKVLSYIGKLKKSGKSLRQIAHILDQDGVPTRHGRPWSFGMIYKIVKTIKERTRASARCAREP